MKKEEIRNLIRINLVNLRNTHKLTQTELGKKVGKGKTAVASWEQGISLPDITTLYDLSKIYNVSLEYFYEDHSKSPSVNTINSYDRKLRGTIKNKYPTPTSKVPATIKVLALNDNGETQVVTLETTGIIAATPVKNNDNIHALLSKKEGGTSD